MGWPELTLKEKIEAARARVIEVATETASGRPAWLAPEERLRNLKEATDDLIVLECEVTEAARFLTEARA